MGTVLSASRAGPGAAIETTIEMGGSEDVERTGGLTETGGTTVQDKDLTSQNCAGGDAKQATEQQHSEAMASLLANVPPRRIKHSLLTDAERAKFQGHVDRIFEKKMIMDRRIDFDLDDIMEVMDKMEEYFKSEQKIIQELPSDVKVVGDLHGQLYDLDCVFREDEKDGKPGWECQKYLFIGNNGGGPQALEIIMALFCLKMLYPDRIFLLKATTSSSSRI